ncbi:MAG: hypothetical protein HY205_07840 [Nitrospirae bacterium]|nr:hypothetical protein [Nitrospirota bacterium]
MPYASRLTCALLVVGLTACSSPKPILYPNVHFQTVGQDGAAKDIEECKALAESAGATSGKGKVAEAGKSTAVGAGLGAAGGAVGGAVVGSAGSGAAIGAVSGGTLGLLRSLFKSSEPSTTFKAFVNHCLKERGYEPVGWE